MPLSKRIRSALANTIWHSSSSSSSLSDADENIVNSPNSSPVAGRGRTPTSESASSTVSIIAIPAHRLKNKFSDLRGKQRRKQVRYNEALVQWAQADEREWLYPTWGGPAKKSRKFSREQRDSLRNWGWDQSRSSSSFECRSSRTSMCSEISPCTSRHNLFFDSPTSPTESIFTTAGRNESALKLSSRAERPCTVYGNTNTCLYS